MADAARVMALIPEEQTLLMVVQSVDKGRPARTAAWRAGAWPRPAEQTLPKYTEWMDSGGSDALSKAALMAMEPSWVAERWEREPWKEPSGVRQAEIK